MRNFILGMVMMVGVVSGLWAQELKITSSPNPVAPGTNVRVTVQSGFILDTPYVGVFDRTVSLQKVGERLYTVSFLIPATTKPGVIQSYLSFNSTAKKGLRVPFQFEVSGPKKDTISGIESRGVVLKTDPLEESNIKIDALEDSVKKLQTERQSLKKQIETAKKDLEKLKNTPRTTSKQLAQKEEALQSLDRQLVNREKNLQTAQTQYQKQLEDLVSRETALGAQAADLRQREVALAKERELVSRQVKDVSIKQEALEQQESDLAKRKKLADAEDVALRMQNQKLKEMQVQLSQTTSSLTSEKELLAEKEKDLQLLSKKLGKEDAGVKAREQELNRQRDEMAKKNADLMALTSQVQKEKKLISESEAAFKRRLQEVDLVAKRLSTERQVLDDRQGKIQERETALKLEEESLYAQMRSLSARDEQLKIIEKTLREEEAAIQRQQIALTQQQSQLSEKEADLNKIQQDISSQNMSLQRLMQDVQIDRVTLTSQAVTMKTDKELLRQKESMLIQEQKTLKAQQTNTQALEDSLARRKQIFEKELNASKMLQAEDRQQLELQRKEINALDLELRESKQRLATISAEQSQRERGIRQAQSEQSSREVALGQRMRDLESKEFQIETLRKDVYDKYMALDALKTWVDDRTYALQEAYALAQKDKSVNTAAFQDQFQKLERLTRMLQHRTRSLLEINKALNQQNEALEIEIQTVVPTESQFIITPYLGYRSFSDTKIKNGANIGLKLMGSFSRDWGFDTGIGCVPTLEDGKSQLVYTVDFLFSRHLATMSRFRFFGLAGIGGRIASSAAMGVSAGLGIRNPLSENTSADLDILYGPDFLVRLGIDMRLRFDERGVSRGRGLDAPSVSPVATTSGSGIDVLLRVPSSRYQTSIVRPVLQDSVTHWSSDDAALSGAFGLLELIPVQDSKDTYLFFPSKTLSLLDGVKLLMKATYLPKMVADESLPIAFTIVDLPGVEYLTKVWVEDELGNQIRVLLDGESRGVGDFSLQWDGLNAEGNKIPSGKYSVKVSLLDKVDKRAVVSAKSVVTVLERGSFDWDFSAARETLFADIPPTHPDRPIINAWMALGNTAMVMKSSSDVLKTENQTFFGPSQPMTRIAFVMGLSRSLAYLGAKSYTIPDLSPYSDVSALPREIQERIGLYISELDYGGDDQRRLRLYDPITRAEAVTLLGRFLRWQSKRFEFPLP